MTKHTHTTAPACCNAGKSQRNLKTIKNVIFWIKRSSRQLFTVMSFLFFVNLCAGQNVGINTTGAAPDASALLDIDAAPSNDKGLLIPRLTTAERDAIATPARSLLIFNTTTNCFEWWDTVGSTWVSMSCGAVPPAFPCGGTVIPIVDVLNPTTGKTWMDRNLGASQAATSSTDAAAYGDLYQWGRCSDGHESRTSATTGTLSPSDNPGHGDFILSPSSPWDWRSPQNDNLWQGVAGINNPCPTGYRLPTEAELDAERLSWATNNAAGAFGSPLKLPVAGYRLYSNGSLNYVGSDGLYWSSTVSGTDSRSLNFGSSYASMNSDLRADGRSVRCLKD